MGTHSTVKFYRNGKNILSIYNQYDGYVAGEGKEILDFLENKELRGNGFDDDALLYVCYKKEGKPYHTYATTENDIQEYNYRIDYDFNEKEMYFTITHETWNEEYEGGCLVTLLRNASFEEFKEFVKTEVLREMVFYKHCEELLDDERKYFRKIKGDELRRAIERKGWGDIIKEVEEKEVE